MSSLVSSSRRAARFGHWDRSAGISRKAPALAQVLNSAVWLIFMSHQRMSGMSSAATQARTFSVQSPQVTGMKSQVTLNFSLNQASRSVPPVFSASSTFMLMVMLVS